MPFTRSSCRLFAVLVLVLPGCGTEPSGVEGGDRGTEPTSEARAVVARMIARGDEVLLPAAALRIDRVAGRLVPRVASPSLGSTAKRADVSFGGTAGDGFRVEDRATKVAVEVRPTLADARAENAVAEVVDGYVVYRGGGPDGANVVHRATVEGTEDLVAFERAPAREELGYEVALGEGAAGLRLVADTLEVLDAEGTPRLRMAPPWVADAAGARRAARVEVTGCAVDRDPRGPWGRGVTAAGAGSCGVRVSWGEVTYPAVVDPRWTTTGSMATARTTHTASVLPNGQVLVAGGLGSVALASAELYEPTTRTWSPTASLAAARYSHAAGMPKAQVVVAGGSNGSVSLASAELYDPAAGTWSSGGQMTSPRCCYTASVLSRSAGSELLVTGGHDNSGVVSSAERYNPTTNTWSRAGTMAKARWFHTASVLSSGKVLVAGGLTHYGGTVVTVSAELYDPTANTWSAAGSMAAGRAQHAASVLATGKVLVAGGSVDTYLASAELYDPAANTWSSAGSMAEARRFHTLTTVSSGNVVVAGGDIGGGTALASAELYDPTTNTWSSADPMAAERTQATASVLATGGVLVVGGNIGSTALASAELFFDLASALPCSVPSDCASGFCSSGVCCNTACCVAGEPKDCAPFVCATPTGTCTTSCVSVGDCAAGFVCDPGGQCVPPPASGTVVESSGACSAAGAGRPGPGVVGWLLLGVLAACRSARGRYDNRSSS